LLAEAEVFKSLGPLGPKAARGDGDGDGDPP